VKTRQKVDIHPTASDFTIVAVTFPVRVDRAFRVPIQHFLPVDRLKVLQRKPMKNARTSTSLVAAIVGVGLALACDRPVVRAGAEKDWTVRAAAFESQKAGETTIWIGLKNNQPVSGLVCIKARAYGSGQGQTRIFRSSTITHACTADQMFSIVPTGETHYSAWGIELPAVHDDATPIDLSLTIRERSPIYPSSFQEIEVEWKGTLRDMLKVGTELFNIRRPQ
jgi:hypothetical protein